ncbi:hypothetical protein B0920_12680 [Massilia sp. KIM]|uniref:hypothetical protein n=1 Tax=Massilia sp. KIM TaxID=1955422 RepID=UPI00098F62AC|nr:hypothetical protein [Massilia sp. KIM]OON64146.1 hypothetical protein B0920_12680 [Massilia sp. KIM]
MLHICVLEKAPSRIEAELAAPLERELREVPGVGSFFSMSMEYGVIFELQFHGGAKEAHRAYVEETVMRSAAGRALGIRHRAVRLAPLDDKRFAPILPCRDAPPMQH